MGPCFVVFAEEFRGAGPKQNSSLLEWGVRGPGAEVISTKSALLVRECFSGTNGRGGFSKSPVEMFLAKAAGHFRRD